MNGFTKQLQEVLTEGALKLREPMSAHTTFRVGGPADWFVSPASLEELAAVTALCRKEQIPFYILGNGSNLLVGDGGFRGVMIQMMGNGWNRISVEGVCVRAGAGTLLSKVARRALEGNLTGLEFAAGIPGTIGGACVMNAGAYGGELCQVLKSARVLTRDGQIKTVSSEELELGYRTSSIPRQQWVVLEAELSLTPGDPAEIQQTMNEFALRRREKQPLEYPSAGSTFKRPEGYFAGKLIQDAGLGGFTVGGAQVSEKHCGFVINKGGATAADILSLCRQVQEKVREKSGVTLEMEVKRLGEF